MEMFDNKQKSALIQAASMTCCLLSAKTLPEKNVVVSKQRENANHVEKIAFSLSTQVEH